MTAERWARIKEVFATAAERVGKARAAYLAEACGPDEELRREVESLLQQGSGSELRSPVHEADWVGREIAHFRVLEKIGAGGMGVVYKAQDLKLDRTVALKFLAPHLVEDEGGRQRFIREAKAAAALDHPNICTVYEIDEADGQTFIAMAYVEGQSVKDKIAERPLKLEDALEIATQTGKGLQAAHEQGIVHRDIKPANIMLTAKGGTVKVMDFGLAQLSDRTRLTQTATILGTPAYMSPEQAQGLPTDRRTDIWSLGAVIYEMVTGCLPFEGERQEAVLYAITNEEPEPITALRAGLPMELEWIVSKTLAKDRKERYQHVEEMIVDLRALSKKRSSGKSTILPTGVGAGHAVRGEAESGAAARAQRAVPLHSETEAIGKRGLRKLRLSWALFAVATIAFLVATSAYLRQPPPEAPLRKFTFTPPLPLHVTAFNTDVAISPNGKYIVFNSRGPRGPAYPGGLSIQDLERGQTRLLEGTEGAHDPFWSPGSDFIAFAAFQELKRVSIQGSPAIQICDVPGAFLGASWSPDGDWIVFSAGNPPVLYEVPASGGTPNLLVSSEESDESSGGPTGGIYRPHFLPSEAGPRVLVFAFGTRTDPTMMVQDLETGQRGMLGRGALPFYSPSGHIIYQAAGRTYDLWALPFSLGTLQATGGSFLISEHSRDPTVAADGTLVYVDAPGSRTRKLVWLNRGGEKTGEISQAQKDIRYPTLCPNGRLVAVEAGPSPQSLWIHDIVRGVPTRLAAQVSSVSSSVAWSPSGEQVAFTVDRAGDILLGRADGSGNAQVLFSATHRARVWDWSGDGKYLVYQLWDPENRSDLWYLERQENGTSWKPHAFLQTPSFESAAQLSPNSRYVAYQSDISGREEIYVRPFPEGGSRNTVSKNGGRQPRWRRDGKELFYVEGEALMAVPVENGPVFSVGTPTRLFEHRRLAATHNRPEYDVSADGERFLIAEPVDTEAQEPSIHIVQNWFAEFKNEQQD